MQRIKRHTKRVLIGLIGGVVVLMGVIMIPYPGPGWLVVFAGLAILATEFAFARHVLEYARDRYDRWAEWLKGQSWWIRVLVLAVTGVVIVTTIWLGNGFGLMNQFLGLDQTWLVSPFFQ
jgi:uncharacterized protein (TIGR02611 family)